MKSAIIALAALFLCVHKGSAEVALQVEKFGASFTNEYYQPGVGLCDTGAVKGTWGKVPDGVAVVAKDGQYMNLSVDDGITFTPSAASEKGMCSGMVSIRATAYKELSRLPFPTGARAAFAIYAPEGGVAKYMGWVCSQNCWTNLYPASGTMDVSLDEWLEVMVRFLKSDDANDGYVQYWLKRPDDSDLVPLKTADDVYWIRTGKLDGKNFGKIGFTGDGDLEWVSGLEPNRGLIVGVGSWYDYLYAESIYEGKHIGANSRWEKEDDPTHRIADKDIRSYRINTVDDGQSVTYLASRSHTMNNVEVTELEVQFMNANVDESIPEDACARIRLVEMPDDKTYRFACLADGQWKTNTNWIVSADAKYTIEISLLCTNNQKLVSYRYKEGYGLEGGAYRDLFLNQPMLPNASGKTFAIDFDGSGIVHEIRGKDGPK